MSTVVELLQERHDRIEDYREECGYNPHGFGGGHWRCGPQYKRRTFAPLDVSEDGNTVIDRATAWTWGLSHQRDQWACPLEMIETCFWALTPERFTWDTVNMGGHEVHVVSGGFEEYVAGFQLHTTSRELARHMSDAATTHLPYMVSYNDRCGFDESFARNYKATRAEADKWVDVLRENYKKAATAYKAGRFEEVAA